MQTREKKYGLRPSVVIVQSERCRSFLNNTNILFSFHICADNASLDDGSVGEVSIQVDLFTHPGTGEHKVTTKGNIFN